MYLIEPIRDGKYVKDGAVALAMQVYVQSNVFLDDDILFPYYCDPKVEIGKFQNTVAEVNEEYLKENKKRLQRIAEGVIAAQGYDYPAAVELGVRYIPQKTYGDITFPAGNYEALNITIGSGQGENWWCVLFPPLCLLDEGTAPISGDDADSDSAKAAADGSSSSEVSGDPGTAGAGGSGQSSVQGSTSAGSSVQSDALTKEQKLKLRWKTLELLKGK